MTPLTPRARSAEHHVELRLEGELPAGDGHGQGGELPVGRATLEGDVDAGGAAPRARPA
ncbi:hypothetical protein WMF31_09330 [Sorangium sp. So ce1036]|uniref:hypothetical protein n=1 Tax=Sorangium sp. So ce1036 TaxID=3133328 RepID=UPI003F0BBD29